MTVKTKFMRIISNFLTTRALIDSYAQNSHELSFKKGEYLNVTNSRVITVGQQSYCWRANKPDEYQSTISGIIPRQLRYGIFLFVSEESEISKDYVTLRHGPKYYAKETFLFYLRYPAGNLHFTYVV